MANIKVAVRIRPMSEREVNITGAEIVVHTDGNEVSLTNLKVSASKAGDSRKRTRRYGFDYCFNSSTLDSEANATQEKVYENLGRSALDALFSGYNACLVAYGQSASGKTYTMMGPKNNPGLTPRLCEGLFFRIFEEEKKGGYYETAVSYLEIYNERVRDLLKPCSNSGGLRVREHPRLGPYVQGLTRHTVSTLGSLMSYVEEGSRARKTASTSQNPTSSRSHALLTVSLTSRAENSTNVVTTSGLEKKQHVGRGARLHLVDLAGSERAGNSNYGIHRLKEGANINKSLVALGNVISALAERGATGSGPGRRFIPYRDSALTWLLKDALGGNATTIMLATISPASGSYNETAHTLRFAQRAQSVVNRPVINEDPVSRVIRELRAEVSRLTSLLSEKTIGGEEAVFCCCKGRPEVEGSSTDVEECREDPKPSRCSSPSASSLHSRWSSDQSISSKRPPLQETKFGSLKSLDSLDSPKEERLSYDRVDALALVDIPTLVAVLIKPDDDLQAGSVQIEEISTENILESSVDVDASEEEFDRVVNDPEKVVEVRKKETEAPGSSGSSPKEETQIVKNYTTKKSSILSSSKKFGSSESFESFRRSEGNGLVRRSNTNLQLERSRQSLVNVVGKAKRNWSPRGSTVLGGRRVESSGKSVPEQQKSKNTLRKQEADSPKRKISKDSSPSGAKDESTTKLVRKGSVVGETIARIQTPIQRTNRRAEIVAAVTERLYSTKKTSEETTSPGDFRSPESTEVKLVNTTRMKLQEISRKMLAKRRKTCVDTQTDVASTVRVKDTASITDSTEVETRDAAMITDLQEIVAQDYSGLSVTRVKEIATLTERFDRVVRFKDVGIVTEECDEEDPTSGSLEANSRIQSKPNFAESSTNTMTTSNSRSSASQTLPEDLSPRCTRVERGCSGCHGVQERQQVPVSYGSDRNVICITLPDMISITIESTNTLESRIAVTEGPGVLTTDEKATSMVRDGETQTEHRDVPAATRTVIEKLNDVVSNDLSTVVSTRSTSCQSDGKTFRIENIFKDPKSGSKSIDHSETLPDLTEHVVPKNSLKLTNSVGTSFTPETTERSTEIEGTILLDQKIASWRELTNPKSFSPTMKRPCASASSSLPQSTWPVFEKSSASKIDAEELKSPLLVARLLSNSIVEVESNFSDDSLDPDEVSPKTGSKCLRLDDTLCPPDVVAHTKKEVSESRIEEDFADEEVEFPRSGATEMKNNTTVHDYKSLVFGRNCFIPISHDSGDSRNETPESEEGRSQFKKKVSFSNTKPPDRPLQVNDARKPKPIIKNKLNTFVAVNPSLLLDDDNSEERNSAKLEKLNASTPQDRSTSENSFRDDISSISESSGTARSGILFNSDEDSDPQSIRRKREESEMKRVRFTNLLFAGERGDSGTSDSEGCENLVSDEESFCCELDGKEPHGIFASYLDEATAFVHKMNTMNEYVNGSRLYEEHNDPDDDFVEYKGCRISLRDDTDQYLKPDEFQVPVDSYKNCLRGIAKLENCIEKAVRSDRLLLDKYGIRLESATTSYSLVDPGKDSTSQSGSKIEFQNPEDFGSSLEDLGVTDDDEDGSFRSRKDLEASIFEHLLDSASHRRRRNCAKPYFRRSTRVSDLRLRKNQDDLGDSKWYSGTSDPEKTGDLKVPQCFLMVPGTGTPSSGSDAVGTSSESIDTVASVRNRFRYPGSPRAKLLQLVSERRQIVHRSRNGSPC